MSKSGRLLNLDPFKAAFADVPPAESEAPTESASPTESTAPAKTTLEPPLITAAPKSVPPSVLAAPAVLTVAPETPHTRVANEIWDKIMPTLKPRTQVVLWRLFRLAAGFNSLTCHVSIGKLEETTGVAATQVRDSLKELERRGLVRRIEVDYANKNQNERGITFEVRLPRLAPFKSAGDFKSAAPAKSEPNKVEL